MSQQTGAFGSYGGAAPKVRKQSKNLDSDTEEEASELPKPPRAQNRIVPDSPKPDGTSHIFSFFNFLRMMFYTIFVVQIQILIQICRKPYETETKDDAKPAPKRKLPSPQVDCLHEPEAGTNIF